MKELKIIIGDASGCTAADFKVNGRGTCVQKAGKAKVGDVARVICKHEFDRTDIGPCRLVWVGPRDKWDLRAGRTQYVWERVDGVAK